jgi:hypothetical protein
MNMLDLFALFLIIWFLLASHNCFFYREWIFRVNPLSKTLQSETKGKKVSVIS